MARPQATDFLHNMRFHVVATLAGTGGGDPLQIGNTRSVDAIAGVAPHAGFMSCTTPDVSVNPAMYKEGQMIYERKYPGETSMGGDLSLDRGVARADSSFWTWVRTVIEGSGEYRADLDIKHFHRAQALSVTPGTQNKTTIELDVPARTYHVFNCFPTTHNITTGALSATDGEISVMSLTVAYEHFNVEEHQAP